MEDIEQDDSLDSEEEQEYLAAPAEDEVPFHIPRD